MKVTKRLCVVVVIPFPLGWMALSFSALHWRSQPSIETATCLYGARHNERPELPFSLLLTTVPSVCYCRIQTARMGLFLLLLGEQQQSAKVDATTPPPSGSSASSVRVIESRKMPISLFFCSASSDCVKRRKYMLRRCCDLARTSA